MKVIQEFYCTVSGGGCGGYILAKVNIAINGVVEVVCPKCSHKHQRSIVNGEILDANRHSSSPSQTLEPTIASYSTEPRFKRGPNERNSAVPRVATDFLNERLLEIYGPQT